MIERAMRASSLSALWLASACIALDGGALWAQILHASGPLPSFEVATIKPAGGAVVPSISTPAESRTMNVTARNLIEQAYRIPWTPGPNARVQGGPGWIDNEHYDVEARIDESQVAILAAMSNDQRKDQASLMMQSLLADRFKLKVHFESRELPIYALSVAKSGPRLTAAKESSATDETVPPSQEVRLPTSAAGLHQGIFVSYRGETAEMTAKGVTLDQLVHWLAGYSEIGGRTIVNRTGLAGTYDFTLRWTRERLNAAAATGDTTSLEPEAPALFTSLAEELGLRLVSSKGPVEVLVIDHIEKPTGN